MAAKTISLRTRRNSRLHGRSRAGNLLNFLFLALIGVFMALPMVYAVSSAFKPLDELFLFPPRFLVRRPTLDNFSDLFRLMSTSWVPFTRYMFNTVMLAVLATAGNVVICSMAAYMLEKRKFPGSGLMYQTVVLALMFSGAVTAIPNYLITNRRITRPLETAGKSGSTTKRRLSLWEASGTTCIRSASSTATAMRRSATARLPPAKSRSFCPATPTTTGWTAFIPSSKESIPSA